MAAVVAASDRKVTVASDRDVAATIWPNFNRDLFGIRPIADDAKRRAHRENALYILISTIAHELRSISCSAYQTRIYIKMNAFIK